MKWLPDPPKNQRPWPPGSTAGQCYFCGGLSGPRPVWEVRDGLQVCAKHKLRARPGLKCLDCKSRVVSAASAFSNMCVPCGRKWLKVSKERGVSA